MKNEEELVLMKIYKYGNPESDIVLIEPVGTHNLNEIPNQVEQIKINTKKEIQMIAIKVDNWNQELSPWKAQAVFGKEAFGDGASNFLAEILKLCADKNKKYYLGGYSLAGLFGLWACCQSDKFAGIAAASPSVWFPDFLTYMEENEIKSSCIYLSIGDREEKTKNVILSTVGDNIRKLEKIIRERKVNCILEWNQGNHFKDAGERTAKAFSWVIINQ